MSQFKLEDADVLIDLENQTLTLPKHNKFYVISTGKNGIGEQENTGRTPRGWHRVAKKIGADSPQNAVFIARKPTGEVYSTELAAQYPERDWILSRILWLDGLEEGFNKGEDHDTMQRYIYIHGTPDTQPMGVPMSHGCVRMRNEEIIELFDLVAEDALVYLSEQSLT
ncbi:cell wall-recycling L,D-carboxypeptidase ElsL [Acinetobacter sp. AYS6]|uniref:cell wall-recycling L,D-carboxypeptidase ElsL n=1 Tax=Acinetobacter TaxID=469 RepID=UPI00029C96B5|nr:MULTISPECIES: cell wall-recycling L,D-carboxypeptidase ElsL [Acinetobacter]EKU39183.1 L,D-transpeptidase catalytic domain protein [Acinetobacter sp. WC-141]MBM7139942.1 L,D-transpeptidase [Acinetobacter sp. 105-3]MCU7698526.1 cell wall-recycling L,D-carboxypeptidase ElsL [Acinetobacter sp. AYS6]